MNYGEPVDRWKVQGVEHVLYEDGGRFVVVIGTQPFRGPEVTALGRRLSKAKRALLRGHSK